MNFENMSTIKMKFMTYHAITEWWSSVYKQIAVFSKIHPSFFANYFNTENDCLTRQHIFKAELVSKSLCIYFKFEIMSRAKGMIKKKEHSPWFTNEPYPPEGIFSMLWFSASLWKILQDEPCFYSGCWFGIIVWLYRKIVEY
jgi:hypothetical protein